MSSYTRDLTKRPARIASRPNPSQWGRQELLTLDEAAALCWPDGPITVRTLRTAVRDGALGVARIAGKIFTSLESLDAMTRCKPSQPTESKVLDKADPTAAQDGPLQPARSESAQALLNRIAEEKARLKPRLNRPR